MSARVLSESALRVSDCVTELLRKQPFFGSLVLRLPLRADPTRQTLASDGQEIRYSPRWVAETDAHLLEAAMARVVMACALKHHTRRGERDPERWQMASASRLPTATPMNPTIRRILPVNATVRTRTTVTTRTAKARTAHPMHRRATIRPAPARSWTPTPAQTDGSDSSEAPVDIAAEGAGVGRGHAPGAQHREGRGQGAGPRRRDGPQCPCEHARLADAAAPLHDRRREPRL